MTRRAPRTDRVRAGVLVFGGWLLLTGATLSFAHGIIHPYYTVVLAPAVGALVGMGASTLWHRRQEVFPRMALAVAIVATVAWAFVILGWSPDWYPALRWVILALGVVAALGIALVPRARGVLAAGLAGFGIVSIIAAPAAYSLTTAATPHTWGHSLGRTRRPGRRLRRTRWLRRTRCLRRTRWTVRPRSQRHHVAPGLHPAQREGSAQGCPHPRQLLPGRRAGGRRFRCRSGARRVRGRPCRPPPRVRRGVRRAAGGVHAEQAADGAAPCRRLQVHLGGRGHRLELGIGLPAGHRGSGDGHRRVQRHRPHPDSGPVREVRVRGEDPLLRRRGRRASGAEPPVHRGPPPRRRSPPGSSPTSRP